MSVSMLCKNCFWFMTSLNCIMEGGSIRGSDDGGSSLGMRGDIQRAIREMYGMLPDSYMIVHKDLKKIRIDLMLSVYQGIENMKSVTEKVLEGLN